MSENLATFLLGQSETRPTLQLGVTGDLVELGSAISWAADGARELIRRGLAPGDHVAIIAGNSTEYYLAWLTCQLAGVRPALINPQYPADLLDEMLSRLGPRLIVSDGDPDGRDVPVWHVAEVAQLRHAAVRTVEELDTSALAGVGVDALSTAGYMHTSGTLGAPKFCAQSHRYHLRLGRLVADQLALSPRDRVFAPLPMFHVNPLGYGFLGALTGLSDIVSVERFSASSFWPTVHAESITALILHEPPVQILKQRTSREDARGHAVRTMFYADAEFLDEFEVPVGMSCYGSTEAGGLSHVWQWRRGEPCQVAEGVGRLGGRSRADVDWRLSDEDEIWVRGREPGVLFSGYLHGDCLDPSLDDEGWFRTGDRGRLDEQGRLVFVERQSESIRVKGEYVPINHVEDAFREIGAFTDLALWRREGALNDDEVVLYVVADQVPLDDIRKVMDDLPAFMRPAMIAQVSQIPRDAGAGKVQRRRLSECEVARWTPC